MSIELKQVNGKEFVADYQEYASWCYGCAFPSWLHHESITSLDATMLSRVAMGLLAETHEMEQVARQLMGSGVYSNFYNDTGNILETYHGSFTYPSPDVPLITEYYLELCDVGFWMAAAFQHCFYDEGIEAYGDCYLDNSFSVDNSLLDCAAKVVDAAEKYTRKLNTEKMFKVRRALEEYDMHFNYLLSILGMEMGELGAINYRKLTSVEAKV